VLEAAGVSLGTNERCRTLARGRGWRRGNALNEVPALCNSMMSNGGVMTIDKTTKLDPAATVLGLRTGEKVALDEGDFLQPSSRTPPVLAPSVSRSWIMQRSCCCDDVGLRLGWGPGC